MRKIESNFMGSSASGARLPCTDTHAILPRRATSMTAPGINPSSMFFLVAASRRLSCGEERPTSSGLPAVCAGISAWTAAGIRASDNTRTLARLRMLMAFLPSIDDGGLDHAPELIAQRDAVGIAHLHHVDGEELLLGVDP